MDFTKCNVSLTWRAVIAWMLWTWLKSALPVTDPLGRPWTKQLDWCHLSRERRAACHAVTQEACWSWANCFPNSSYLYLLNFFLLFIYIYQVNSRECVLFHSQLTYGPGDQWAQVTSDYFFLGTSYQWLLIRASLHTFELWALLLPWPLGCSLFLE